jgi:hypothetical protein
MNAPVYNDPFLGMGSGYSGFSCGSPDMMYPSSASSLDYSSPDYGFPADFASHPGSEPTGTRRRVKIALKSMPSSAAEGGEWEVQFC